jgi:hypothetical protein
MTLCAEWALQRSFRNSSLNCCIQALALIDGNFAISYGWVNYQKVIN